MAYNPWKPEDIEIVRQNYLIKTYQEIGDMVGRSSKSIGTLCEKMGWRKKEIDQSNNPAVFKDWEKKFIRDNLGSLSYHEMAEQLPGRSKSSIGKQAAKFMVGMTTEEKQEIEDLNREKGGKKRWTEAEDEILRLNHDNMSREEIAAILNRSFKATVQRCQFLNLHYELPKEGDVIHGWKILRLFTEHNGRQNRTMAEISSENHDEKRIVVLSYLVNDYIAEAGTCTVVGPKGVHITHGLSDHPLFGVWAQMVQRATNPNLPQAKDYCLRGIDICKEWLKFKPFFDWSSSNGWKEGLWIERVNNDLGYSPDNCKWATPTEQQRNKRSNVIVKAFDEEKTAAAWLEDPRCRVKHIDCILWRIRVGWSGHDAVITPPRPIKDVHY